MFSVFHTQEERSRSQVGTHCLTSRHDAALNTTALPFPCNFPRNSALTHEQKLGRPSNFLCMGEVLDFQQRNSGRADTSYPIWSFIPPSRPDTSTRMMTSGYPPVLVLSAACQVFPAVSLPDLWEDDTLWPLTFGCGHETNWLMTGEWNSRGTQDWRLICGLGPFGAHSLASGQQQQRSRSRLL